ncbi:MAG: CHAT domain-containing tetratricopeptide repeat protein [Devosia sp.]
MLRGLLLALLLLGVPMNLARADPAADVAAQTAAIEAVLKNKDGVAAEALAKDALAFAETTLGADSLEAANLQRLYGDALFYQDRFAEAEPHYRTAFELRQNLLGTAHLDTAVSANDLAIILKRLERYTEAEPFYRLVMEIRENVQGRNAPETARAAFFLARIIESNGKGVEAAEMMGRAIGMAELAFGADDPTIADWMIERAAMLHDAGESAAAEPAYLAAISKGQAVYPPNDTELAFARHSLGNLYAQSGRNEEAVPLYRAALAAREVSLGTDDSATISSADRLARALWQIDQIEEAEGLFRRVLVAREGSDGADSPAAADALRWLGRAAAAQDRLAEAEIVFKRALAISEQKLGSDNVLTGFDLIALGQLYSGQERFVEARPLLERAVAVFELSDENRASAAAGRMALSLLEHVTGNGEKAIALAETSLADMEALHGKGSRETADVMVSLASYQQAQGDLAEAERMVSAARDIYGVVAPDSRALVRATSELGRIREAEGRYEEAMTLHRAVLDSLVARYGEDSTEVQPALADLGSTLFALGDYEGAAEAFGKSTAIVERLAAVDAAAAFRSRTGEVEDQAIARAGIFDDLIKSIYRMKEAHPEKEASYAEQSFAVAQRVLESEAAGALAQMAARQSAGTGELAALVRERQDLVAAWRREDAKLTLALSGPPESRDADGIVKLRDRLDETDRRITAIDARLAAEFAGFAALQKPKGLGVADVQARLGDDEVLIFFADTGKLNRAPAETFAWVVPKTGAARWLKLGRETGELAAAVRELRNSMGVGGTTRGPNAVTRPEGSDDTSRVLSAAKSIHDALLGDVEDMIAGRSLVIVPSRSLSALPFHALVSALPDANSTDRYREAKWLARDHAITILPSVASLLEPALRSDGAERTAYLAFANPLLSGRSGTDMRAFTREGCAPTTAGDAPVEVAELPKLATLFRGATANVASVRALPPLPETTDEVCAIAALLGAGADALHLGADASESVVKALSDNGDLARTRVLHFATHGLVSGELSGLAEPAIVLTPPAEAEGGDDGLLTASEVTTLKLDADWVILSACNTASSDGGGEALSGLARAFFYAGAHSLMVSHWPVNSEAAVRLASGAVSELAGSPEIGKAEALRRAMVAEIDAGGARANPASWAPFIVVGAR